MVALPEAFLASYAFFWGIPKPEVIYKFESVLSAGVRKTSARGEGGAGAGRGTCSQNTSNPLLPPRGQLEMAHFQVSCSKEAGATTEYL